MRHLVTGLWRHPEFLKLWAASAISDVGSQLSAVALPLMAAVTLGASAWQMGLLSAAGSAPTLLVGLFTGVWVDRLRRRPVLIAADVGRAALLVTIPVASALGLLGIELLYVVALAAGSLTVLFDVAHLSYMPSLVDRDQLVDGNSKLETTAAVAQVAGPATGGVVIGALGAAFAIVLDALSFLVSAFFLMGIRTKEPAPEAASGRGVLDDIREGILVVVRQPVLRVLAGCSATTNLFGWIFFAVYVLYMTRDLGLSPMAIGFVLATGGVGSFVGSLVVGPATRRLGPGPTMIVAQVVFGITGMAVPLAILVPRAAVPMLLIAEFGQWMAYLVYYVSAVSIRQAITPDRVRGRVNATMRFVAGGALPIGSLIGGALGTVIGLPLTLVVAQVGMLFPVLWLLLSRVRGLTALPDVDEATSAATP
jgi:MFS family permease